MGLCDLKMLEILRKKEEKQAAATAAGQVKKEGQNKYVN